MNSRAFSFFEVQSWSSYLVVGMNLCLWSLGDNDDGGKYVGGEKKNIWQTQISLLRAEKYVVLSWIERQETDDHYHIIH